MTESRYTPSRIGRAIARRSFKAAKLGRDLLRSREVSKPMAGRSGPVALESFKGYRHEVFLGQCLALTGGLVLPRESYSAATVSYERDLIWRDIWFSGLAKPELPAISNDGRLLSLPFNLDYFRATDRHGRFFLPYFAHPQFYRHGMHSKVGSMRSGFRNIGILFAGTFPSSDDNHNLKFPIMPRHDVLKAICDFFSEDISHFPGDGVDAKIALFASKVPGDNIYKHRLSVPEYIKTVARSRFSINPPGFMMPQSHNLIEALSVGTIPILNYASYMRPRLRHMKDCLEFHDADSLRAVVSMALSMDEVAVDKLRRGALSYYDEFVDPWRVGAALRSDETEEVFINSEFISVQLMSEGCLPA